MTVWSPCVLAKKRPHELKAMEMVDFVGGVGRDDEEPSLRSILVKSQYEGVASATAVTSAQCRSAERTAERKSPPLERTGAV